MRNSSIGLLSFYVAGCKVEVSPEQARLQEIPFQILTPEEVRTVDALGESLLPGSSTAGLAHFIDHQLNAVAAEQMLMIKYLGVSPPFAPFYSAGLAALNVVASDQYGHPFAGLDRQQAISLVGQITQGNPKGWNGPPAPFFYFVLRNDAVDVVYGTREGIESLGIPYMAHIEPPSRWGR